MKKAVLVILAVYLIIFSGCTGSNSEKTTAEEYEYGQVIKINEWVYYFQMSNAAGLKLAAELKQFSETHGELRVSAITPDPQSHGTSIGYFVFFVRNN